MKKFNEWIEEREQLNENVIAIIGKILNKIFNPIEIAKTVASIPMGTAAGFLELAGTMWNSLSAATKLEVTEAAKQMGMAPINAIAAFLKTLWHASGSMQRPGQEVQ